MPQWLLAPPTLLNFFLNLSGAGLCFHKGVSYTFKKIEVLKNLLLYVVRYYISVSVIRTKSHRYSRNLPSFCCRHQIQARHPIVPLPDAGMENRIQVLKTPVNILQLAQDKTRTHFPSPGLLTLIRGELWSQIHIWNGFCSSTWFSAAVQTVRALKRKNKKHPDRFWQ